MSLLPGVGDFRYEIRRIVSGSRVQFSAEAADDWYTVSAQFDVLRQILLVLPMRIECEFAQQFEQTYDEVDQIVSDRLRMAYEDRLSTDPHDGEVRVATRTRVHLMLARVTSLVESQ